MRFLLQRSKPVVARCATGNQGRACPTRHPSSMPTSASAPADNPAALGHDLAYTVTHLPARCSRLSIVVSCGGNDTVPGICAQRWKHRISQFLKSSPVLSPDRQEHRYPWRKPWSIFMEISHIHLILTHQVVLSARLDLYPTAKLLIRKRCRVTLSTLTLHTARLDNRRSTRVTRAGTSSW